MVGDLGLGKTVDMSSRLTMIAGTPTFVAPEQAQGERIDARADQYSLAALAYLLLTGRPPHRHATLAAAANPGEPDPMSTPEWPVPPAVEAVVRRGLAADRDERWPDVAAFTAALAQAAGSGPGPVGAPRVLPIDPQRTQPGARPSPLTAQPPLADPPRRPVRGAAGSSSPSPRSSLLVAGGVGGYAAWQGLDGTTTLSDSRSTLTVTVPDDWDRATATDGWQPPDADTTYPALSVGSSADWETDGGEGVFVGVLPGSKLPTTVPGHPECGPPEDTIDDERDGDRSMTVYFTDCPYVTVERVVQVAANRLLWVQVRADTPRHRRRRPRLGHHGRRRRASDRWTCSARCRHALGSEGVGCVSRLDERRSVQCRRPCDVMTQPAATLRRGRVTRGGERAECAFHRAAAVRTGVAPAICRRAAR